LLQLLSPSLPQPKLVIVVVVVDITAMVMVAVAARQVVQLPAVQHLVQRPAVPPLVQPHAALLQQPAVLRQHARAAAASGLKFPEQSSCEALSRK